MGEALISRTGGGGSDSDVMIPVTPGYHTVLVTLKDYENGILGGFPLSCKDGTSFYNYNTNEKGQCLFVCNSGSANILANNYNGSYQYLDFNSKWTNIDAPVGLTSRVNIVLDKGPTGYDFTASKNFTFLKDRVCNLYLVGGGGGGGCGDYYDDGDRDVDLRGGGGGAGYLSNYINQTMNQNKLYKLFVGSGGRGGRAGGLYLNPQSSSAGGTTYIENTSYSARGGSGGGEPDYYSGNGGAGGLGSGAGRSNPAGSSSVSFAGGGGGGGNYPSAGSPYGGRGATTAEGQGANGSRGGGGGGGYGFSWTATEDWSGRGGWGGAGVMRINITY